jgi:hypothetical protein
MYRGYAMYLALKTAPPQGRRCCDDVPASSRARRRRGFPVVRWTRKTVRAVPASMRAFRRSVSVPIDRGVGVGAIVVAHDGSTVGRIADDAVPVRVGQLAVAIAPTERIAPVLVPTDVLSSTSFPDVVRLERGWERVLAA